MSLIDREAAIEDIRTMIPKDARLDIKWIEMWLMQLPSAQPDNSCDGCRYENADDGVLVPCGFCKRSHPDNYERRTDGTD